MIDLAEPDNNENASIEKRTKMRIEQEQEKFDDDHYLADYFDDTEVIESTLLTYKPDFNDDEFTDKQMEVLKSLPKRTYALDKEQKLFAYLGLVDILFAYCYNNRINCGEKNVESGWTIAKLSSTLSYFNVSSSTKIAPHFY